MALDPPPFRLPDPQEEHRGQVSEEEAQEQLLRQVVVQAKARYHGALRSLENLSNQAMAMAGEVAKNRAFWLKVMVEHGLVSPTGDFFGQIFAHLSDLIRILPHQASPWSQLQAHLRRSTSGGLDAVSCTGTNESAHLTCFWCWDSGHAMAPK